MAPCAGCFLLAVMFSASCKAITSSDQMCTEDSQAVYQPSLYVCTVKFLGVTKMNEILFLKKEANKTYNCENLGLTEVPDTLPNTTEFLEFGFNFLPVIENTTFTRLIDLMFLDLTRCQINWVHEDTFQYQHQLNTIVLTGNPLIFMAETAFNGPKSLKHLSLIQTGISNLEFIPVYNLEQLESLHLGSNHISSIKFPENFPTQNLKVLDFQNNAIYYISSEDMNALEKATNLSLNFNGNDIKAIEPGAFHSKSFQSLKFGGILNLSVILKGLQNSTTQSLWLGTFEDSDDQDLTPAMLEGLCEMSVESINLQKHHFSNISSTTFRCFTQLKELDLTATHLKALPSGIESMNALKKLVLNVNNFDQLCQINAASFPSLTDLSIKGNMKTLDFGAGCLEKLENLQKLDLSHNDIEASDCCNLQLKNLPHLQYLNLSYNEPLGLQSQAFKECPQLEHLDLAFTHLRIKAPQSPFQNLRLLQVLNLSHCLLDTSNQHLLAGLVDLRHLNLQGNHFQDRRISKTNLLQPLNSLEILSLSSCDLLSIDKQAFQSLGKMSHVDLSYNSLTGDSIDALSHLQGIYLNLAVNSIHAIPPLLLHTLSQQNTINLSHNPLDCTCSNIHFITWYKENLQKIEGVEETMCANPPSLRGVKLYDVELSCGITAVGIFFLIVFLLFIAILLVFSVKFLLRWKYEHI